ncbi:MAG: hypothetical protein J5850_03070, partial [Clostridia bacterium]|nr:hypothetical protein [Clostridia bacterium]
KDLVYVKQIGSGIINDSLYIYDSKTEQSYFIGKVPFETIFLGGGAYVDDNNLFFNGDKITYKDGTFYRDDKPLNQD